MKMHPIKAVGKNVTNANSPVILTPFTMRFSARSANIRADDAVIHPARLAKSSRRRRLKTRRRRLSWIGRTALPARKSCSRAAAQITARTSHAGRILERVKRSDSNFPILFFVFVSGSYEQRQFLRWTFCWTFYWTRLSARGRGFKRFTAADEAARVRSVSREAPSRG